MMSHDIPLCTGGGVSPDILLSTGDGVSRDIPLTGKVFGLFLSCVDEY